LRAARASLNGIDWIETLYQTVTALLRCSQQMGLGEVFRHA
jgi:hypothetical protein